MIGVVGLGAVSPFGVGVEALSGALRGESAPTEPDPRWGADPVCTRLGVVPGFRARKLLPDRKAIKVMSRDAQFAVVAGIEACGLDAAAARGIPAERFGAFAAAGYEAAALRDVRDMMVASRDPQDLERLSVARLYEDGRDAYHPLAPLKTLPNMALFHVGTALGLRGPQLALGSSAASGIAALGEALDAVKHGEADAALAFATDSMTALSRIEAMVEVGLLPGETWPAEGAAAILLGVDADVGVLALEVGQAPVSADAPEVAYGPASESVLSEVAERLEVAARAAGGRGDVVDVRMSPVLGCTGAASGLLEVVLAVLTVREQGGMARVVASGWAGDVAGVIVGAA